MHVQPLCPAGQADVLRWVVHKAAAAGGQGAMPGHGHMQGQGAGALHFVEDQLHDTLLPAAQRVVHGQLDGLQHEFAQQGVTCITRQSCHRPGRSPGSTNTVRMATGPAAMWMACRDCGGTQTAHPGGRPNCPNPRGSASLPRWHAAAGRGGGHAVRWQRRPPCLWQRPRPGGPCARRAGAMERPHARHPGKRVCGHGKVGHFAGLSFSRRLLLLRSRNADHALSTMTHFQSAGKWQVWR